MMEVLFPVSHVQQVFQERGNTELLFQVFPRREFGGGSELRLDLTRRSLAAC